MRRRISQFICLLFASHVNVAFPQDDADVLRFGSFSGPIVTQWLEHDGADRDMLLVSPVIFYDRNGKQWEVTEGSIINGASIPRIFWTYFGAPFVGDYRKASVIHDHFCYTKSESWRAVHRMFLDALLVSDVPLVEAVIMYAAVYVGSEKWGVEDLAESSVRQQVAEEFTEDRFGEVREHIRSLEEPDFGSLDEYLDEVDRYLDSVITESV